VSPSINCPTTVDLTRTSSTGSILLVGGTKVNDKDTGLSLVNGVQTLRIRVAQTSIEVEGTQETITVRFGVDGRYKTKALTINYKTCVGQEALECNSCSEERLKTTLTA